MSLCCTLDVTVAGSMARHTMLHILVASIFGCTPLVHVPRTWKQILFDDNEFSHAPYHCTRNELYLHLHGRESSPHHRHVTLCLLYVPEILLLPDSATLLQTQVATISEGAGDVGALLGCVRLVEFLASSGVLERPADTPYTIVIDSGTGTTAIGGSSWLVLLSFQLSFFTPSQNLLVRHQC